MAESAKPAEAAPSPVPASPAPAGSAGAAGGAGNKSGKMRPKSDFGVKKWARFRAQKTGSTLITNSMGGHDFGAQIPGSELGPQNLPFFARGFGPERVFLQARGCQMALPRSVSRSSRGPGL